MAGTMAKGASFRTIYIVAGGLVVLGAAIVNSVARSAVNKILSPLPCMKIHNMRSGK